jgi:sRNA-binding protein
MTSNTADTDTAPSPQPAPAQEEQNARRGRKHRRAGAAQSKPQAQQPAPGKQPARPRRTHPVLERLFELYPGLFGARFLPLKLGVFEDLKVALGLHARSTRYLEAVAAGKPRHDLNGVPVEPVAPEHVHHAILEVFRRRQARSSEDLRPQLRARLMAAVEASGLSREDYMLVVRSNDETANAVLDEAFAELGARNAKREALRRAFEASGRSVAEFAEMYGMDPAEVKRTLAPARARPEAPDPA